MSFRLLAISAMLALGGCMSPTIYEVDPSSPYYTGPEPVSDTAAPVNVLAPYTPSLLTCDTIFPPALSTGNSCMLSPSIPADPSGSAVTYVDGGSTCPGVTVNSTTGNLSYTAPAKNTSCVILVKASNGVLLSAAVASDTITAQNNAPAFPAAVTCPLTPVAGTTGVACTLTAASPSDLDGDTVTYSNGGSTCSGVVVNASSGVATFTAPAKGATCVVRVKAYDGTAYSSVTSSGVITGADNAPNTPSSLSCATSPLAGSTGNSCSLTAATPADPDGDAVTYSDGGSTCGSVVVNSTSGAATFTAPAKGNTCVIKVRAHDGASYSSAVSSATITGQNNSPNTPSTLSCATSPTGGSTGNTCTLTAASPADQDGDSVTYSDNASTCSGVVVNSASGAATFTAPAKGASCVVKVRAYDGSVYSSAVSSSTITGQNNSPNAPSAVACSLTPLGGSTGNSCTLTAASPTDPDSDSVTYSDDGSTCASVVINSSSGAATFTAPAKSSTCVVKIRAYDGLAYSSTTSSGTITGASNAPNPPSALSCTLNPAGLSPGNTCSLTAASPTDPDGDAVTYADDASSCASVTVNSTTGNATFTAPAKGATCTVKVKAYDGALYSSAVSSGTITGANNAPATPTALSCATTPLAGSTSNACTLTAASPVDSDGDTVSYSDDGSTCASIVVSALTGAATFTAPIKGGNCVVKVRAYDGVAYSSAVSSATITAQNNAPTTPTSLSCVTTPIAGSTGNACTLTAASPVDSDGDSVTYSDDGSTCGSVVVNATTGNATFTAPAKGNTCVIKVRAHDGSAYSSAVSSSTITAQNNAPTQPQSISCPASPPAGSTGNSCTLTAASPADIDGDAVSYVDDSSTCSAVTVNATTGEVSFTAPASGGSCTIRVKAYDSVAYSTAVSATIGGANNAPNTPTSLACATTPLGLSTNNACTLTAASPADPDGDTVSYSDDGSTCGSVVVNATTGNATFTAPAKNATCVVKVRAHDGQAYSSAVSSSTITAQNNAPATPSGLSCATTPAAASTGNACTLTAASPADIDSDSVTYSDDGSTCSSVVVNATTGSATFTAPAKGNTCVVKVRAHDGTAYSSAASSATITAQNNAPAIPTDLACTSTPLAGSTGNTCSLTAASPADTDGDSVTYSDSGSTCTGVTINGTTGGASFTAPAKGATCVVKVRAYDGVAYSTAITSNTITGQNNAPSTPASLSCATTPLAGSTGNACTLTAATPADTDGDSVSYSDDASTCSAVTVNATTGNATFTAPAKGGSCVVKVRAHDGAAYSSAVSSATITAGNNTPNTPTSLTCTTTPAGGSTGNTCTLTAASPTDPDGDSVTYSDDGSTCSAVTVDSGTGSATFTAPASGASCVVKVRSHDGTSYSSAVSSATITGQNNAPNTPTSLSCATTPLGGSSGNTCTLTAASPADPDGQAVTYSDDGSTCSTVSVNGTTGDVTFTAPAKGNTCVVKVRAFDGTAYSSAVTSATITGQNNAPATPSGLACTTTPVAASTGNTCTLTAASPVDSDGDSVTYSDDGSTCAAASISSDGSTISFTAPSKGGTCVMKVRASDGTAYSSTRSSATITGQNRIPNTPSISCVTTPLGGSTGNTCTLTPATPVDPDGDAVTYSNDGSSCGSPSVSSDGATITFTAPAKSATCVMKVRAHDGTQYSTTASSATITGQNNAPNIPAGLSCTTTPLGGAANQTCTLTAASPVDPDGDSVTYINDSSTCGSVSVTAATGATTFTAPAKGATCVVKIQATDGTATSSTRSSATITGQNNPPAAPASLSCPATPDADSTGNSCTLTAAGTPDLDNDTITYINSGSTCASPSVSADGSSITFTAPAADETCVMSVKARDSSSAESGAVSSATITGTAVAGGLTPVTLTISSDRNSYDIFTEAGSPATPVAVTVTINAGVKVGDSARLGYAMRTGTFPATSTITIINNGSILGYGGNGGNGDTTSNVLTSCTNGQNGGNALYLSWPVTLTNNGTIAGGGGGGGGGAYAGDSPLGSSGGGGGAGFPAGTGGTGTLASGNNGTATNGGARVQGGQTFHMCSGGDYYTDEGSGGAGGTLGGTGTNGTSCSGGTGGHAVINDGSFANRILSTSVLTDVKIGIYSTCIVANSGVKCTGNNSYGELGDNSTTFRDGFIQTIASDSNVVALGKGNNHSCALSNDGGVKCWGRNHLGQLGNGSTTNSLVPIEIFAPESGVTTISAGGNTTCAVISGGVQCWGSNSYGQLGNDSTTASAVPVQAITASSGATAISVGSNHACAVVNGGLKCWGLNNYGQLGDGSYTQRKTPIQTIAEGSGVTAVSSGESHTCAVVSGGVKCWGDNGSGRLGDGSTTIRTLPVQAISEASGATAVAVGESHSCAIVNGGIQCWGYNSNGQLGDNSLTTRTTPVQTLPPGSGAVALEAKEFTSCAVVQNYLRCWGSSWGAEYGSAGMSNYLTPKPTLNGLFGSILGPVSF